MMRALRKSPFKPVLLLLIVNVILFSTSSHAGECKAKAAPEGMLADAIKMATLVDLQVDRLAKLYREQTGKELKVILVSRAGQNFNEVQVLQDTDAQGKILTPKKIIDEIEAVVPFDPEKGGRERRHVFEEVLSRFSDKSRALKFSHMGVYLRNHPAGRDQNNQQEFWWFRHQLRPCADPAQKREVQKKDERFDYNKPLLWDEGIGRFFSDDPHELRAQLIVLTPELQDRVEALVLNPQSALSFNGEFYNAAAHWQNPVEQNSNQWVLEVLGAAMRPLGDVRNRSQAQQVLKETGYRPTSIAFWGRQQMALLPGATAFAPYINIRGREQPYAHTYQVGEVISTLSIVEYLARRGQLFWAPLELHIADRAPRAENTSQVDKSQ